MPIQLKCPYCRSGFAVSSRKAGQNVRCAHCARPMAVAGKPGKVRRTIEPLARSFHWGALSKKTPTPTLRGAKKPAGAGRYVLAALVLLLCVGIGAGSAWLTRGMSRGASVEQPGAAAAESSVSATPEAGSGM